MEKNMTDTILGVVVVLPTPLKVEEWMAVTGPL